MSTLLIPVALDADGRIVHAHEGERGRLFRCPGCKGDVLWRRCDEAYRRSHFAHRGDSCGESAIHHAAKLRIAQSISDWFFGVARRPSIVRTCHCGSDFERPAPVPCQPPAVEKVLPSGLIPDVSVGPWAIEVLHKHPVDAAKIAQYKTDGIQWVEIRADGVLEDPPVWRTTRGSAPEPWTCLACREKANAYYAASEKAALARLEKLARRASEGSAVVANLEARYRRTLSDQEALERAIKARASKARFLADDVRILQEVERKCLGRIDRQIRFAIAGDDDAEREAIVWADQCSANEAAE